jgi:hypothetical protein
MLPCPIFDRNPDLDIFVVCSFHFHVDFLLLWVFISTDIDFDTFCSVYFDVIVLFILTLLFCLWTCVLATRQEIDLRVLTQISTHFQLYEHVFLKIVN